MENKILTREIVIQQGWDKLEVITADMLDGYTEIGYCAFRNCFRLTSVTIPNNITHIGYAAFNWCLRLTSVTIPNSVTSIGSSAFANCTSIKSIAIPNSVTSIGSSAFEFCFKLTSVTIPNSVMQTEFRTFYGCGLKVEKRYDEQGRLIAYKGFNADMSCRGFQYEEGETYQAKGKIELCKRGFHACTNPLDCFNYYCGIIGYNVVYHEVYLEDVSDETGDDSKVVAKKITIGREITLSEMADIASGRK